MVLIKDTNVVVKEEKHIPSDRNLLVLRMFANGMNCEDIGKELFVDTKTVHTHLKRTRETLEAENTVEAYKKCIQRGYLSIWDD